MTASILQDGSSQFHLDLEAGVDTNQFQVQMSEATTIIVRIHSSVLQYSDILVFKPQMEKTSLSYFLAAPSSFTESLQLMK